MEQRLLERCQTVGLTAGDKVFAGFADHFALGHGQTKVVKYQLVQLLSYLLPFRPIVQVAQMPIRFQQFGDRGHDAIGVLQIRMFYLEEERQALNFTDLDVRTLVRQRKRCIDSVPASTADKPQ